MLRKLAIVLASLCMTVCVHADAGQDREAHLKSLEASLTFEQGTIVLPGGIATVELSDDFEYLNPEDTAHVLTAWGGPLDESTLGMILPALRGPFRENSWATVLSHVDDGYVSDKDAQRIDYEDLLGAMQGAAKNAQPGDGETTTAKLVGWAVAPHYDAETKKLSWAKELAHDGKTARTLNYDVRILGRHGVLKLSAVADIAYIGEIDKSMGEILSGTEFNSGHRYTDFDPNTDKVATYGLEALVADNLVSTTGALARLGVLVSALNKYALLFAIGAALLGMRFLRGRDGTPINDDGPIIG